MWVIHTVGPVWRGGGEGEPGLLGYAYLNSLREAERVGADTIAFPAISTGVYGYPKKEAARIALAEVLRFLKNHDRPNIVYFVCFTEDSAGAHRLAAAELLGEAEDGIRREGKNSDDNHME